MDREHFGSHEQPGAKALRRRKTHDEHDRRDDERDDRDQVHRGRSFGRRRCTQNTVGTRRMTLAATVSSETCTESQKELLKPGSSNTVRYQWKMPCAKCALQAEPQDRVDRDEEEQPAKTSSKTPETGTRLRTRRKRCDTGRAVGTIT